MKDGDFVTCKKNICFSMKKIKSPLTYDYAASFEFRYFALNQGRSDLAKDVLHLEKKYLFNLHKRK